MSPTLLMLVCSRRLSCVGSLGATLSLLCACDLMGTGPTGFGYDPSPRCLAARACGEAHLHSSPVDNIMVRWPIPPCKRHAEVSARLGLPSRTRVTGNRYGVPRSATIRASLDAAPLIRPSPPVTPTVAQHAWPTTTLEACAATPKVGTIGGKHKCRGRGTGGVVRSAVEPSVERRYA